MCQQECHNVQTALEKKKRYDERAEHEKFAEKHPDQFIGCVCCSISHHVTAFCDCGRCFFVGDVKNDEYGTFVKCECGKVSWWD